MDLLDMQPDVSIGMDVLPTELVDLLCSYLPNSSLKSFRCTCKAYAEIGESHLFQDFEFKLVPSHHRLYQLEQLGGHPTIAPRLRCLTYESGVQLEYADYRYWQAQVYQSVSSARSRGLASNGMSKEEYARFHSELQARFTPELNFKYELYRWHLDHESSMMAESRVRNSLIRIMSCLSQRVPKLNLKILMSEPQIELGDLEAFDSTEYAIDTKKDPDPRRRVAIRRKNCLSHFVSFLEAGQLSDLKVTDLTAIDMPHQLLTVDSLHGSNVLDETFRGLQRLSIKVGAFPHSDWLSRGGLHEVYFGGRNLAANRLARLLNQPLDLEELRLEFPIGKEAEYSYDIFDRTNIDRFPRLWLPKLTKLSLCHFRCNWADLEALLRAARTVSVLELHHCRLEIGSMMDLLHFLPTMKLESISLEGVWRVDDDEGEWHSHNELTFTDCIAATIYEGPYLLKGQRSKVEKFALHGGQCPLPKWTVNGGEELVWEMDGDTSWHYLPGLGHP